MMKMMTTDLASRDRDKPSPPNTSFIAAARPLRFQPRGGVPDPPHHRHKGLRQVGVELAPGVTAEEVAAKTTGRYLA